jgi:chromosome partitioning protein
MIVHVYFGFDVYVHIASEVHVYREFTMKVIVTASGKGGTGKTLVAATLAIRLARQRKGDKSDGKVGMIDLNADQASLTQWWVLRGRGVSPYLMEEAGSVIDDVKTLSAEGYAWCLIDTPPTDTEINEFAILVADLVIIPVRPAFLDMNATDLIVDICRKRKKKFAFLINSYDGRPQFRKANTEAIAMLAGRGPIFETRLPYSAKFIEGQSSGKTGPELDKALAASVDALLEEVKAMISKPAQSRSTAHA